MSMHGSLLSCAIVHTSGNSKPFDQIARILLSAFDRYLTIQLLLQRLLWIRAGADFHHVGTRSELRRRERVVAQPVSCRQSRSGRQPASSRAKRIAMARRPARAPAPASPAAAVPA